MYNSLMTFPGAVQNLILTMDVDDESHYAQTPKISHQSALELSNGRLLLSHIQTSINITYLFT